jgi:hypothetical protein
VKEFPEDVMHEALESLGVDLDFVGEGVEGHRGQYGLRIRNVTESQAGKLAFTIAYQLTARHDDMESYRVDMDLLNELMGSMLVGHGSRNVNLYFPGWRLA